MSEDRKLDERVEPVFRNGTITVVGIVAAFSLGFVTNWAANPIPWHRIDLFAVIPILVGIGLQIKSLADLLHVESLERRRHDRATRIFMAGLLFTAAGVAIAILLDVFRITGEGWMS
jgi:ABC-type uncharacterized transport system permease subunit